MALGVRYEKEREALRDGELYHRHSGGHGQRQNDADKAAEGALRRRRFGHQPRQLLKRHDELPYEERCRLNYDHPDAFDTDLMVEQVQALRRGETIACPVYDFTVHNRSEDTLLIAPTSVIILEGILIFADSKLRDLMDVKIFVDTDADVRILRRVVRDVKKRGRTLESVVQQYLTTVKPMHEQFVEPSKRCADIIVPEGGKNLVALDMIIQRVEHHIRGQQEP